MNSNPPEEPSWAARPWRYEVADSAQAVAGPFMRSQRCVRRALFNAGDDPADRAVVSTAAAVDSRPVLAFLLCELLGSNCLDLQPVPSITCTCGAAEIRPDVVAAWSIRRSPGVGCGYFLQSTETRWGPPETSLQARD